MDTNKKNLVEALLFIKGESLSKKYITETLSITEEELSTIIESLKSQYTHETGIIVVESEGELAFGTNPSVSDFLETIEKEERGGELSKASLETLSIVLYKNGATRSEIDYVRGVNSSFILRNLYLRGLVEKRENKKDSRSYIYVPTIDTLRYLGITHISELPLYEETIKNLETVFAEIKEEEHAQ